MFLLDDAAGCFDNRFYFLHYISDIDCDRWVIENNHFNLNPLKNAVLDNHTEIIVVIIVNINATGSPLYTSAIDPITGIPFSLITQANTILMPVFRTVRLNTGVTVQDGATVVVGGLIQQKIETVVDKVPVLGDLPLVGRLFQSQGLKNTKTAVIMFVKVELVDPTGQPWRER